MCTFWRPASLRLNNVPIHFPGDPVLTAWPLSGDGRWKWPRSRIWLEIRFRHFAFVSVKGHVTRKHRSGLCLFDASHDAETWREERNCSLERACLPAAPALQEFTQFSGWKGEDRLPLAACIRLRGQGTLFRSEEKQPFIYRVQTVAAVTALRSSLFLHEAPPKEGGTSIFMRLFASVFAISVK